MPRYFFDIEDGDQSIDEEGQELANQAQVPKVALLTLFDVATYEVIAKNERLLSVIVRDENGGIVYRASVALQAGWVARAIG